MIWRTVFFAACLPKKVRQGTVTSGDQGYDESGNWVVTIGLVHQTVFFFLGGGRGGHRLEEHCEKHCCRARTLWQILEFAIKGRCYRFHMSQLYTVNRRKSPQSGKSKSLMVCTNSNWGVQSRWRSQLYHKSRHQGIKSDDLLTTWHIIKETQTLIYLFVIHWCMQGEVTPPF